ncbi:MAG: sigma-70 family RNA polymerase sigma factor [Bryobacterales bacterium]|nr:sigma-70 family RNA polymerase sigma factor [Bryobacterales bacterium]
MKLRSRLRRAHLLEDIKQETLLRVIKALRRGSGVEYPERFGAYVSAVCNNVLLEFLRNEGRHDHLESEDGPEDHSVDLDAPLISSDRKKRVEAVLSELPEKDREILRMLFLEEQPREAICRRFEVDGEYLRVLVHRAKWRFRNVYAKRFGAAGPGVD